MRARLLTLTLIGVVASLATTAAAQSWRDRGRTERPVATLYEGFNFQGRSIDIYASDQNLDSIRFNDRARSARFQGRWRVCEDAGYGGRCQDVEGDFADLNRIGMAERISSLQAYGAVDRVPPGGDWRPGGGPGRGDNRGTQGAKAVFFAYPSFNGYDIAAGGMSANTFCRSQGLGPAVYYDSSERAARALDGEGRHVTNTTILRDILCRRY